MTEQPGGQDRSSDVTRRDVLAGISGAGLGALTVGAGTASASTADRHIVGTETPAATAAARRRADVVDRELDFGDIGQAVVGRFPAVALDALRQNPHVRYVEVDGTMTAIGQTLPWGIDRIDADVAHSADSPQDGDGDGDGDDPETGGDDGTAAHVAIVDTGIDDDHPDLDANVGAGKAVVDCGTRICSGRGCSGNNCNEPWSDDNDHGTHVAGTADAEDNARGVVGASTAATLHAVKVLDCNGCGSYSDVAAGIKYVADQGWDVANMSLGGSHSSAVEDAVEYADGKGVLLVAAAGNQGPCTDCVSHPAAEPEVVAVSATTRDDQLADFSSTGPEVELAAPGTDIYSTVIGGYDSFSGTSMASPHVAGAGGQLMANGFTNTGARDQLDSTAEDIGLASNEQGNGLADVEAALALGGLRVDSLAATEVETADGDAEFDVSWSVSDPDGNLDAVDLVLDDATAGTQDDAATVDVSGDTASGTTRLIAQGDEGSDHSYEVTATVTDADGNSDTATAAVAESEDAPAVDGLSLTEVETDDGDAEFDVSWTVSDADGDLDAVDLVLTDADDGETEDTATVDASGDGASGTTRLIAQGEESSGHTYEVTATVTDTDGTSNQAAATATESEDTTAAPAVQGLSLAEDNGGGSPHAEFVASWSVSDDDGDLDAVDLTLSDLDDGETEGAETVDVGGTDASGTTGFKAKFEENSGHEYEVGLVVTDSAGTTDSATATEVEDGG